MIRARRVAADDLASLHGALAAALALPRAAREYAQDKLTHVHLLLSGLSKEEFAQLKALATQADAPGVEPYPQLLAGDRQRAPGTALLSGRLAQHLRLARELGASEIAKAILEALHASGRTLWKIGESLLPERTSVMGVVNVTPDSFSDGGKFLDSGAAISHGLRLVEEGADILDIGGESTRPGGGVYGAGMTELSDDDELARVLPVIQGLAKQTRVPISIDTRKLHVARAAIDAGATIVNDVSGLSHAPELARLVAECGASLCLMHSRGGDFRTMQVAPTYDDLLGEITTFLSQAAARAQDAGVAAERIAIDPGIGFGKTLDHNLALLNGLGAFTALGYAVMVGASRKSFIGALSGTKLPAERLQGSIAAAVAGAMRGASIVRVHDVKPTVEALKIADAVLAAT